MGGACTSDKLITYLYSYCDISVHHNSSLYIRRSLMSLRTYKLERGLTDGMRRMLNGNFIKGLLIKLLSWLFVNASGASGPFHNRDRARFGCILGEIGAFGPRRPWLALPCASEALMPLSHRECIQSVHYPLNSSI